jgi:L-alanine-DL-glutamate epimerase-like enolase superfamily enzyme
MKISRIGDLHADAGWRVFSFLKIETDAGLVGWSEYNESYGSKGLTVVIMKLAEMLIGQDPRPVERDRRHPGEVRNGSVTRALQRCRTEISIGGLAARGTAAGSSPRTSMPPVRVGVRYEAWGAQVCSVYVANLSGYFWR